MGIQIEDNIQYPMKIQWYNKGASQIRDKYRTNAVFSFFTPDVESLLFQNDKLRKQFQLHSEILETNKTLHASARMEVSLPPKSAKLQTKVLQAELGELGDQFFTDYIVSYDAESWYTYKQLILHSWYVVARVNTILYIPNQSDDDMYMELIQLNLAHFIQQVVNQLQSGTILFGPKKKWREHALIPLAEKILGLPNIIYNVNVLPRLSQILNVKNSFKVERTKVYSESDICVRMKVDSFLALQKKNYFGGCNDGKTKDAGSAQLKQLQQQEKKVNRMLKNLTDEMELIDVKKKDFEDERFALIAEQTGLTLQLNEFERKKTADVEKFHKYLSYAVSQQQEAERVAKDGEILISDYYKRFMSFETMLNGSISAQHNLLDCNQNPLRCFKEIRNDIRTIYQGTMDHKTRSIRLMGLFTELEKLLESCRNAIGNGVDEIATSFQSKNFHLTLKEEGLLFFMHFMTYLILPIRAKVSS